MTVLLFLLSIFHHALAGYALLVGLCGWGALRRAVYRIDYHNCRHFLVAFAAANPHVTAALRCAAVAVLLSLVVNQAFDNIVTRAWSAAVLGLHPVLAIFALSLGALLFGVWECFVCSGRGEYPGRALPLVPTAGHAHAAGNEMAAQDRGPSDSSGLWKTNPRRFNGGHG